MRRVPITILRGSDLCVANGVIARWGVEGEWSHAAKLPLRQLMTLEVGDTLPVIVESEPGN